MIKKIFEVLGENYVGHKKSKSSISSDYDCLPKETTQYKVNLTNAIFGKISIRYNY